MMDRSTENTNLEVDQKMTNHKRTADPDTDQRTKFCRASPTTSAQTDSTERRDKRLKRRIDVTRERKDERKKPAGDDKGGNRNEPTPSRSKLTSPPCQWISSKRILNVENSLAFGMEMLPAFSKHCFSSSSSLPTSFPSSSSLSVSQAHKSMDQRHGPNLSFLPPIDKGLFALLRDANFYCGTKAYTSAVGSLNTALQVLYTHTHSLQIPLCKTTIIVDLLLFLWVFYSCTSLARGEGGRKATSKFTGCYPLLIAPFPPLTCCCELLCLICCFMPNTETDENIWLQNMTAPRRMRLMGPT